MSGDNGTNAQTAASVPKRARRVLITGTFAGVTFAEAMSSMRLFSLGEQARYPWFLAWLLPGALDVYALTMVGFFSLLAATHPLRRKAATEAAIALVITVLCNTLEEINEAFAAQLPPWAPNLLFVLISALAPFIAFRLIHFWAGIGNGATAAVLHAAPAAADAAAGAAQQPAPQDEIAAPQEGAAPHTPAAAEPDAAAAIVDVAAQQPVARTIEAPQIPAASVDLSTAAPEPVPQQDGDEDSVEDDGATRLVPKNERIELAINLMAEFGRDNVSGTTVGDALGKSRDTGIRVLRDVNKLPDLTARIETARARLREAGEPVAEEPAESEDPDRELVLA